VLGWLGLPGVLVQLFAVGDNKLGCCLLGWLGVVLKCLFDLVQLCSCPLVLAGRV
jgi:hypothetical protein